MKTTVSHRHTESGFSIVELVVVIGIMGILLSIVALNFNQWLIKNRVEAQVRKMTTDFSELRVKAFTTKRRHSITINRLNYVFKSYSSVNEDIDEGVIIPSGTYAVEFPLKKNSSEDHVNKIFDIDSRGLVSTVGGTIYLDYQNASPVIDCLTLNYARINPGKRNAAWSNCDDK